MTKREVNNVAVENAMWEACQKLRNDEVGKKLWNFMKRTWVTALSELKRDVDAPDSPEERREHFAKAFISDTLWRLYQSTEHGTMDISSSDAEQLFINVLSRPRIFPAEAGGSLAPPPKPWKLILDVVEDTFLEVTDAKVKDHSGTKPKKRKPPSKKPPGKFGGGGGGGGGGSQRPPAPSQDVPFWYRKLMGMEDAQPAAPARSVHAAHDAPPLPRWGGSGGSGGSGGTAGERRSPERWDPNGGSWSRWQAPRSSARPTQRSRSPRGPTNALRHVHIPPLRAERPGPPPGDWRSVSRRGGRRERRRSRERRRGTRGPRGGPRRGSRRREAREAREAHEAREVRQARTLSRPGGRKRSRAATVTPRGPRSASPGQRETRETREARAATRTATRSPRSPRETSKQPEASASRASSECSSPRAKSKARRSASASKASKASSKASKASKESQEEQAEVEEAKRSGSSSAEESQEKEKEPHMEEKKEQDESQAEEEPKEDEDEAEERSGGICLTEAKAEEKPSGGICLTEAKDVKKEPQEEDKDMFDDLDDVGLMAQLQGTLKEEEELAAPEDESAEEADAEEAKESESHGEVCANVAKGICLNKEAPRCKTPFSASDRGGVFAGVFCHSCSEILECGWGEDRKKVDL